MDHGHLSMVVDTCPWVFAASLLNACGTDVKFCRRQRVITPLRLGLALTAPCASQRVETMADFHGGFPALFGTTITSKAFYKQVATPHCAEVARTMTQRLIRDRTRQVLGVEKGHAFAEFRHRILQDGSAFAMHDGLREVVPGRCTAVKPAAVARHTTLDLLGEAPTPGVLTPATARAQACVPEPASLRASVLLADRGSVDCHDLRRVQDAGGFLLIRAQAGMQPQGVEAWREDGQRRRSLRHKPLKVIHAKLPKRQRVARVGQGQGDAPPLRLRLRISWNRQTRACGSWVTTLPSQRSHLDLICRAYKWRWQGDGLWQEWKSYAHLQAFDTAHPVIVEGCIGAAIAAAALQRFLAPRTPRLVEVPLATRTVAMCAVHVLGGMVQALQTGDVAGLSAALEAARTYLACHAQRAHPKRDRHTGRAQLGLASLWGSDNAVEFAEAA